jgi:hypothetical protein
MILLQAIEDWGRYRSLSYHKMQKIMDNPKSHSSRISAAIRLAKELGFASPRLELIDFFNSDWFESLCDFVDLNPDNIRSKLCVPRL